MTLEDFKKKEFPDTPGVYFFLGPRKKILYIGKATSLRNRVRSYFTSDLLQTRGRRITAMIEEAKAIEWRETDSVLEALILEASLIKSHRPAANILEKDDKSFNYVIITKENYPRVMIVRGKDLGAQMLGEGVVVKSVFGPFPQGTQLKIAMKLIRRIFPYRDNSCTPAEDQIEASSSRISSKGEMVQDVQAVPCFNRQIGLCPGVCTGEIHIKEYAKIIRHLTLFFQAKKKTLLKVLEKEMMLAAKEERFEVAARFRQQMFALTHINDVALIKDEFRNPHGPTPFRVEAYDIAHLMGGAMVGVMTVVINGHAQPAEYRKFKINSVTSSNDTAALKEVLSRRLTHPEWQLPKLIVVDGSTAQLNAADAVLDQAGIKIPLVGVVKDERHRPKQIKGDKEIITTREHDILLANAEAHRFAISYHRAKQRKASGFK